MARRGLGPPPPVHDRRDGDGRDLRVDALSRAHRRGRDPLDRPPLRGSRAHARREPVADLPASPAAAHRSVALRRRGPLRGARPRRVRRDDHRRGEPPRRHADAAACGVPGDGHTAGGRDRPEPRASARFARGPHRAARPLPASRLMLRADIQLRLGTLDLAVALQAEPGEVVAVLGPNGAGKTTLLRAIAGLIPIASGSVVLDDVVLEDTATRTYVPTERRPIGVVFQTYLLFPHLSVIDNIAFGLRARGHGGSARAVARGWLERIELTAYAEARPGTLSGGQQQRVALARALATGPRLLLLGQPLAAVD